MSTDKNNFVYFGLSGEFDPEVVAAEVGVKPANAHLKQSIAPDRNHPRTSILRFAQVHADADAGQNAIDFYDLTERVVDQLEPYASNFSNAIKKHKAHATFQLVLTVLRSEEVSTPALGFSCRVIRFIAATGAEVDVDIYRG